MATETTPGSLQTLDNLRIAIVPSGSNALSAAILNGGTTKLLTYSLQPDGWDFPDSEAELVDARLTLGVDGSKPGKRKVGPVKLKYVYGAGNDVAKPLLVKGFAGSCVVRDTLANSLDFVAAQKVDKFTFVAGAQRKVRTGELQTIEQLLYIDAGSLMEDVALIA